jgi:hypothetical protein
MLTIPGGKTPTNENKTANAKTKNIDIILF